MGLRCCQIHTSSKIRQSFSLWKGFLFDSIGKYHHIEVRKLITVYYWFELYPTMPLSTVYHYHVELNWLASCNLPTWTLIKSCVIITCEIVAFRCKITAIRRIDLLIRTEWSERNQTRTLGCDHASLRPSQFRISIQRNNAQLTVLDISVKIIRPTFTISTMHTMHTMHSMHQQNYKKLLSSSHNLFARLHLVMSVFCFL